MSVNHNSQVQHQTALFNPRQAELQIQSLKQSFANLEKTFKILDQCLAEKNQLEAKNEKLQINLNQQDIKLKEFQKTISEFQELKKARHDYLREKIHELEILTQREILMRKIYHEYLLNTLRPQIDFYFLKNEIKMKNLQEKISHIRQHLSNPAAKEMKAIIKKAEITANEFERSTYKTIQFLEQAFGQSRTKFITHLFYTPQLDLELTQTILK